jgi:putative endonuclease
MSVHDNSRTYFVYILASGPGGTLYIGVTNDLLRRVKEHKEGIGSEFTKKYGVYDLVYYEITSDVESAITREKQLKKWNREWKIDLIIGMNPKWKDLYDEICV